VDAVSRSEFWQMLEKLKSHNITIIVSTPYMDEAMRCDRVALIQTGKILLIDRPDKIKESFSRKLFTVKSATKFKLINALRKYPQIITAWSFGESVHITLKDDRIDDSLYGYLIKEGIEDPVIQESPAGIEDRFLELMEKGEMA
jgi:ABC-type multidrug transport system ATPase subunit